jgi:transcriptional regulator with GAF, ATPase, and Fis domain
MSFDMINFFREATLRICGSLEVEEFLDDSFQYLSGFIPVEQMALSYYNPNTGKQTVLAIASSDGARLVNQALIQTKKIQSYARRTEMETLVIERAELHPTAQPWIASGWLDKESSLIVMRVFVRRDMIGAVIFIAPKAICFNSRHENLVNSLRQPFAIALANSARYQELLELKNLLALDYHDLQKDVFTSAGQDLIGSRFGLKEVMELVRQVAPLNSPVLLFGESGTGKELVAAAIHRLSPRKEKPFIKVNCGAIPESLIDSELFGHEKGAFTGALSRKRGRFERAHGGTIFLDEIGELKPDVQVRLLRVLQEKEIDRVGGVEPVQVDIRVIAATHRDLDEMVKQERFRQDLYFRIKVFPINIPPLRERKGDIPSLVDHFLNKKCQELGLGSPPKLAPDAIDRLMVYDWPGNVRELENAVERSMILNKGHAINFNDIRLPSGITALPVPETAVGPEMIPTLDQVITRHISQALKLTGGQVGGKAGAANKLDVNPSSLRKKMRKLGIPFGRKAKS